MTTAENTNQTTEKILALKELWLQSPIPESQRKKDGLLVLEALAEHAHLLEFVECEYENADNNVRISPGLNYRKRKYPPTLARVLTDLMAVKAGVNPDLALVSTGERLSTRSPSGVEIIASMMTQLGSKEDREALAPFSVPATASGLGSSQLVLPQWAAGVSDGWRTAISVPGMVTNVHRDYFLVGQAMQHIQGKKLWMIWPPQESNISERPWPLTNDRGIQHVIEAIQNIPGLIVYWCEEPATFTLPPYTLHSVLTFEMSTHTGVRVCSSRWMRELRLVAKAINDYLLQEPPQDEGEKQEWIRWRKDLVKEVAEDIRLWAQMDGKMADTMQQDLNEFVDLGRNILETARKILS